MEHKKGRVVGQGATAMDYVIRCSGFPGDDAFERIYSETLTSGGSCANVLVTLAHLGTETALVAQIGQDALGAQFRRELLADGVRDDYLFAKQGGTTMHTYVFVRDGGSRAILVNPGDSYRALTAEQIPDDILRGTDVLFIDGSLGAPSLRLCALAAEEGVPIFYQIENLPSHMHQTEEERRQFRQLLAMAHLVCAGRDVYRELGGAQSTADNMRAVWQSVAPADGLVCTAGEEGALWYNGEEICRLPAYPVKAVDSTGAGDSFCGGLIYQYYLRGRPMPQALRFANACGAMKCLEHGPRLRASEADVEAFLRTMEENK